MDGAVDEIGRAIADLARAVPERPGEAATADMTRAPVPAQDPKKGGRAREEAI